MSAVAMMSQDNAPALPSNIEAEAALLGGLMVANHLVDAVADSLTPAHFFEPLHGRIFTAIVREVAIGKIANPVTLKPYFTDDAGMREVGGPGYLAQLTGSGAAVIGVKDFAKQIQDLALLRALIGISERVAASARDTSEEVSPLNLIAEAEKEIGALGSEGSDGTVSISAGGAVRNALKAIERNEPGVTTGIAALDDAIGPIRPGNLAIMAARPGMGKTSLAISAGRGVAANGHGVLFVSIEMSADELGEKLACDIAFDENRGGVLYDHVTSGNLSQAEFSQLMAANVIADELPFEIIDAPGITPAQLAARVKRWKRRFEARGHKLELVIVDYLQKMRVPGLTNRFEVVTEISQSLKEIAKANGVGVLALAQLSRKVEERADKRPTLADLRESGQIEQDADIIFFLLRDEYYLRDAEPHRDDPKHAEWEAALAKVKGDLKLICAKRRKGEPRTKLATFYGAYQAIRG